MGLAKNEGYPKMVVFNRENHDKLYGCGSKKNSYGSFPGDP